jgi:neutral ceramidase
MRTPLFFAVVLIGVINPPVLANGKNATSNGNFSAGVGRVDITPDLPIRLAGSPSPELATSVKSRLYVKALVISAGGRKLAIVTLDTLKYPVEYVDQARSKIEQTTGIPASNVIITASHTHSGPLWTYYKDVLVTPIAEAVALAARDLSPVRIGTSKGKVEGVALCRRVLKDGSTWNRWQLARPEADKYPAEGPTDPDVEVLALVGKGRRYKAVVYNFASHAANNRTASVSADYPGDVQAYVEKHLGYQVPTFFLTGACGDVNPNYSLREELFGEELGEDILHSLGRLEFISKPDFWIQTREEAMPGREHPELKAEDIALKWPAELEHYETAFYVMKGREKSAYQYFFTGIRIGDDFAITTNANELFCQIGLNIKRKSTFKHTMVVEQTNGAHGYVPTAKAFQGGGYETWFGEHSYLSTRAGEIIEKESVDILNQLKAQDRHAEPPTVTSRPSPKTSTR